MWRIRNVVHRNVPRYRDPEAFHQEKSEVTADLTKVITALRKGTSLTP